MSEAGGAGGGVAARRAIVRWAVRMVRRGWRQQILVLTLLTVAVGAAIGLASTAYNLAPVSGNAEFGSGNHFFKFDERDAAAQAAGITAAREWFAAIDVIGHRNVAVPGRFQPLDYRAQDPRGAYSGPLLALRSGHYPARNGEVAVTDGVADDLGLDVGAVLALDGTARTVVGIVENPSDLGDEFALVPPANLGDEFALVPPANLGDEFALVPPAGGVAHDSVTVLVDADMERARSFRPPIRGSLEISSRGTTTEGALAAASVLAVAVVALLFIALLAAAGFVVIAQQRRRQLGMLGAIGATERHLRLAMIANGAVIGVVAAVVGAVAGVVGWLAVEPRLETAVGYRVERFDVPWWVVVTGMVLAVGAATAAAWWPARVAAQASIVEALSGQPPRPRAAHRSAVLAGLVVGTGVVCLLLAGDLADDREVHWADVALAAAGTVATIVGVLLLCPLAVRLLGACARPLPVAARLALRDLARYSARSGAALAAIVMALGIPAAIGMAATAAEHSAAAGNLPEGQLVIRGDFGGPFVPEAADIEAMRSQIGRISATFDGAEVTELVAAIDPRLDYEATKDGRIAVTLVERVDEGWADLSLLYVATPALVAPYGVDLEAPGPTTGFITVESGELGILGVAQPSEATRRKVEPVTGARTIERRHTSVPGTFVTAEEVRRRGWQTVSAGRWLVETDGPPTSEQLSAARQLAAGGGLTIEDRDDQAGLSRLRSGATAVGVLLALGVLAMTVGLIRGEAAPALRTLTATGATGTTRRALTAVTAAALAALGVVLGTVAAFTVLTVGYLDELARLPLANLLVLGLATPLVAAFAGWLLAGREPPALSRQAIA